MKRERRPTKAEQYKDAQERKYEYFVAPADPDETWFRHHNWEARRQLVRKQLVNVNTSEFALNRYDECGGECLVEWSDTEQRYRLRANYCHCRHCAPCARAKATTLSKNLRERLEQQPKGNDRYRFITLTLKHRSGMPLRAMIDKLYKCFATLRKTKLWKNSQRGGCTIFENKWSAESGFHPHLHITAEGDWMRQESLSKEWLEITGDSFKVDIRSLKDAKDTAFYVSKYVTKGINDEVWLNTGAASEWICASKGLRICATYGTWRGFALLKIDRSHEAKDWKPVALLTQIAARAKAGSLVDQELLIHLHDSLTYDPHKRRIATKSNENTS